MSKISALLKLSSEEKEKLKKMEKEDSEGSISIYAICSKRKR